MSRPPSNTRPITSLLRKGKARERTAEPRYPLHHVKPVPRAITNPAASIHGEGHSQISPIDNISSAAPNTLLSSTSTTARPSNVLAPEQSSSHPAPKDTTSLSDNPVTNAPRPRKRYRKKVFGLFDKETDLEKRMSKIWRQTSGADVLAGIKDGSDDITPIMTPIRRIEHSHSDALLTVPQSIIDRLRASGVGKNRSNFDHDGDVDMQGSNENSRKNMTNSDDEFDPSPEFVEAASRVLGSPEKLRAVRKTMGKLNPKSNELFFQELEFGLPRESSQDLSSRKWGRRRPEIKPPELPTVEFENSSFRKDEGVTTSPISVERSGTPAILRRKARRVLRGYRSVDVLKARRQGTSLTEVLTSPTSLRSTKAGRTRSRGISLQELEKQLGSHDRKPTEDSSVTGKAHADETMAETDNDSATLSSPESAKTNKRRHSGNQKLDKQDKRPRLIDPLQMLVEVAEKEGKQIACEEHRGNRTSPSSSNSS